MAVMVVRLSVIHTVKPERGNAPPRGREGMTLKPLKQVLRLHQSLGLPRSGYDGSIKARYGGLPVSRLPRLSCQFWAAEQLGCVPSVCVEHCWKRVFL